MQVTPDGDYTRTGVEWNKVGYNSATHRQFVTAPDRSGLYYFRARTPSGLRFAFPWIVAPARPDRSAGRAGQQHHLERVQQLRRPQQLHPRRRAAAHADRQLPLGPDALPRRGVPELERAVVRAAVVRPPRAVQPHRLRRARSPTPSRAGRPATSPRPSGGCSAGSSSAGSPTTSTPRPSSTTARSTSSAYRVLDPVRPSRVLDAADVRPRQAVGLPRGRPAALPRRQRPELRGRDPGLVDAWSTTARSPAWTSPGSAAESRFALRHESEANLLGVVFTPAGAMTGAPYRVVDAGHWVFDRTGLKEGDLFGRKSLHRRCPGGASGHETDKLSPSSPAERAAAGEGIEPRRRRRPHGRTSRRRAAAPSSRSARSPGSAASRSTSPWPRSPRTSSAGSWIRPLAIEDDSHRELDHPQDRGPHHRSSRPPGRGDPLVAGPPRGVPLRDRHDHRRRRHPGIRRGGDRAGLERRDGRDREVDDRPSPRPDADGRDVRRAGGGTRADGSPTPRQPLRQGGRRHRALGPLGPFARRLGREPRSPIASPSSGSRPA